MLVDANLLVYAKMQGMPQHEAARRWLEEALNGTERVGLPWASLLAFLRLVTHPRVFDPPLSTEEAWAQVQEWLNLPVVWVPTPTTDHPRVLGDLIAATEASGNLIPDAHLAAIAMEHGLVLASTDGDFARFPELRWENPLA
jgi:toxin-antitoxin system PIN domain toxin